MEAGGARGGADAVRRGERGGGRRGLRTANAASEIDTETEFRPALRNQWEQYYSGRDSMTQIIIGSRSRHRRVRMRFAADACFSRTAVINDRANAFAAAHLSLPPRPSPPPFGPRFTRVMGIDDHDTFTGLTPLQQACLDGNIEKVLELVDAGADVDIQANGEMAGKTAAMIAASEGSTDILKAMNRGPSLLNLKDADGGTAAMTAAVHKHGSVLDYVRPVFFPPPGPKRRSAIAPRARAALPRARASGIDRDPRRASSPRPNPRAEVRAPRPPRASTPRQPAIAPIAEVRVSTREKKEQEGFPHRSDRDDGSIAAHVLEAGRPARPSARREPRPPPSPPPPSR